MFVPFATSAGAATGLLTSLALVLWTGLGQVVARQHGTIDTARFAASMNTSTAQCPASWLANTTMSISTSTVPSYTFPHLALYDLSYM